MYSKIFSFISGLIFGIGLTVAGMVNPAKVIAFLNILGNWDPSLVFVMVGAIIFSAPFFYILKNKKKPFFNSSFQIPSRTNIDRNLIIGSSLFGVGWGLVGYCPGPAIASLAYSQVESAIFLFALFIGLYADRLYRRPTTII